MDERVEGRGVFLLLLRCDANQADLGEGFEIEEVGVERGHEAAVFVAEDDGEGVDAAGGEEVEVALPVIGVVEAGFEVGAVHGVKLQDTEQALMPTTSPRLIQLGVASSLRCQAH